MARGRDPVEHRLAEFVGRHAGVGRRHDLQQALFAGGRQRLHVLVEQRLERLRRLPFRMLRRHRLDAIEGEHDLEVDRLFAPQRAVIVEGGDALLGRHEVGAALRW